MPTSVLGIEGYEHVGQRRTCTSVPAPALLRLPTAALTDSLDGRTGIGVDARSRSWWLMVVLGRIGWRVRRWARSGDDAASTERRRGAGRCVAAFVLGTGTTDRLPRRRSVRVPRGDPVGRGAGVRGVRRHPGVDRAAAAAGAAGGRRRSRCSRCSAASRSGIGPAAALALLGDRGRGRRGSGLVRVRGHRAPRARRPTGSAGAPSDGWRPRSRCRWRSTRVVNVAKFGTLFSVPYDHQAANDVVPGRRATLAANGGTLVNVRALPTNLLAVPAPGRVPPRRRVAVGAAPHVAPDGDRRPAVRHARLTRRASPPRCRCFFVLAVGGSS